MGDEAEVRAVGGGGQGGDVLVVVEDCAVGGVVEAFEEGDGCGFAAVVSRVLVCDVGGFKLWGRLTILKPLPERRTDPARL